MQDVDVTPAPLPTDGHLGLHEAGLSCAADADPILAAIDVGTNNCRLLIARGHRQGFRIIDAFSRIVRLGEGITQSERLSDVAINRAIDALRICRRKMDRRGVTALRAVATEACRRARNCRTFVARAADEAGIPLEIISSEEEGRLALAGSSALLDRTIPYALVFDIGGGSTELLWIRLEPSGPPTLIDQISLPCGVICLAERFGDGRATPDTFAAMVDSVATGLAPFEARHAIRAEIAAGRVQMLGTSGTVTTLAGVHMGLMRYDRARVDGTALSTADARRVTDSLLSLDWAGRAALPCVGPDRADLVLAGCAVLDAIIDLWPVDWVRIADRGLREGILMELLANHQARRASAQGPRRVDFPAVPVAAAMDPAPSIRA